MPDKNWQFELEEYIKQGEPAKAEKSEAWQTAIGLQAVDGLKTSEYLLDTAKDHIEGKITIDEAQKRIHSYYEQRNTRTETENETKEADIVIAACGKANMVKSDWLKDGAIVIDVGINRDEQGKLCGDVDFEAVEPIASMITPVPGGVGPMTITMLLKNTLTAAKKFALK